MTIVLVSMLVIPMSAQAIKVKICVEFDDSGEFCLTYSSPGDDDNDDDLDDDGDDDDKKCKGNGDSESDDC